MNPIGLTMTKSILLKRKNLTWRKDVSNFIKCRVLERSRKKKETKENKKNDKIEYVQEE